MSVPSPRARLFSFSKSRYNTRMIASLEGTIELKTEKFIVLNVSGIGYRVFLGMDTLQKIPEKGGNVKNWCAAPARKPATSFSIACGWSPVGEN